MAHKDFERFRQEIKSWMDRNPDKYDAFVEEVNGKSFDGIQYVYSLAMRLASQLVAEFRDMENPPMYRLLCRSSTMIAATKRWPSGSKE